ncbi:uncharacterized protein LOC117642188 [Thrips palmi]|uniref:Uncharacterized protein LOC117642188 n=1 Tax=Thrips palmi TaxID=161013 RepID=A0A6P8YGH6_THRPL|nr:uncharacterized protein LOC117642188 [Thrips palmi]
MARVLLVVCLVLAALCFTSSQHLDSSSNDAQAKKKVHQIENAALDPSPSHLGEAQPKQKRSPQGWGYTTSRYPTSSSTTPRWPTTRRPSTTPGWPTTRRPTTTPRWPTTTKSSKDQSFVIGGLYQNDRQLERETVYKSSTFLSVNTKELSYSGAATIHCIQVVDLQINGKNAAVKVQSGGVGQRRVNLKFKSQRGEKINYLVIIWGQ